MLDGTTPTLQSTIGTNYYGNVWLALASIAYADEKSASGAPAAIKAGFAGWNEKGKNYFPAPTLSDQPIPGTWAVDWGPLVQNREGVGAASLMYVVAYRTSQAPDTPYMVAVVIRGTDTKERYQPGS